VAQNADGVLVCVRRTAQAEHKKIGRIPCLIHELRMRYSPYGGTRFSARNFLSADLVLSWADGEPKSPGVADLGDTVGQRGIAYQFWVALNQTVPPSTETVKKAAPDRRAFRSVSTAVAVAREGVLVRQVLAASAGPSCPHRQPESGESSLRISLSQVGLGPTALRLTRSLVAMNTSITTTHPCVPEQWVYR
jgi:hypothetical protein